MWNRAFSSFLKLSNMNIKKLCIRVDDKNAKILLGGLNLRSRSMLWLHKLRRIDHLEMPGLEHSVGGWQGDQEQHIPSGPSTPVRKRSTLKRNMNHGGFLRPRCSRRRRMIMVRTHCCVVVFGTLTNIVTPTYPPSIQLTPPHQDLTTSHSRVEAVSHLPL